MPIPLVVLLWGLLAVAVITSVGRWCRARPGLTDTGSPSPTTAGPRPVGRTGS